jgi:ribosome-binding factor A
MPSPHKSRSGKPKRPAAALGPSQRQLRAGELVRHSLAEILREEDVQDPALAGVSVTVTEVRMSPDLRHATCFVEPLGAGVSKDMQVAEVVAGLNRASKFLRGRLGQRVDLKFTPDLKFRHDDSFDEASHINALFARPEVARDLNPSPLAGEGGGEADG